MQQPSYNTVDATLYAPQGCRFVAPGESLRGNMKPLYDTYQVRTYEADPVFMTNSQLQAVPPIVMQQPRGVEDNTSSSSSSSNYRAAHKKAQRRKFCCC